ncbi:MAG: suppressor of fused domain protein, partial [Candidatus Hydrogenedentota bacterium]
PANIELILGIGQHQHWASNLLKLAAEYPSAQGTFYAAHHTLPFGGELGDGSSLSAFLFIEPRILPPNLSDWMHRDPKIGFLQAVPITTKEHAFAVSKGSKELETLLAKAEFLITPYANRPSVVTASGT